MGEQRVSLVEDNQSMQQFVRLLLHDVKSLEYMLENDWFEKGVTRIGAEQEMCLVNAQTYKPSLNAMEALDKMKRYPWVETELAKFNLETNLTPHVFKDKCLSKLDKENTDKLQKIRAKLAKMDTKVMLTGILPTLTKSHMIIDNLTPKPRYYALMDALEKTLENGTRFKLNLEGIDELRITHDSAMLEACNTSFQVHLQVSPDEFVKMYNIAQALAGPTMAIAANSPIVFGKRLWHESRIALFQQALDTRSSKDHLREKQTRVHFGKSWLDKSVLEIYREDIARFRVLLAADVKEDSLGEITAGRVPKLRALQVHNSTVYRWNRPCYGVSGNGKPHLRIENRVLPAGPTEADEVANAAFWLGCMVGMADKVDDIRKKVSFADVSDNFLKAAKFGIDTNFTWFNDKKYSACALVLKELLPLARRGLEKQKIAQEDIDKYLGIIEGRAKKHMNGARWQLRAYTEFCKTLTKDEALTALTKKIIENQEKNIPVHRWKLPDARPEIDSYRPGKLLVEQFMETDLFTVRPDDIVELTAELMNWRKIRYMPVEDEKGELCGLMTSRLLLRHFSQQSGIRTDEGGKTVKDLMIKNPITASPDMTIIQAMHLMRDNKLGCLPVVKGEKELIGVITEMDFLRITGRLMERLEKG